MVFRVSANGFDRIEHDDGDGEKDGNEEDDIEDFAELGVGFEDDGVDGASPACWGW